MLNEFIEYLNGEVNRAIYCWGGQGQTATEELIRKMETSTSNANKAIALLQKLTAKGVKNIKMFDCSGLAMYFLQNLHHIYKTDMSANTLLGQCEKINKSELRKGDWVFSTYANGKAYHIGYVVDDSLRVVESQGRAYGVVKRALSAGNWNTYGRPKVFKAEIEAQRNLHRGDRGEDVRELQNELRKKGYFTVAPDGIFGEITLNAVKAFQKDFVGVIDGIAGPLTREALEKKNTFRCTRNLKNIRPYMRGDDITCLQEALKELGYFTVAPDGLFGDKTEAAVRAFQKKKGVSPVDGIAGIKTTKALGAVWEG